jgi:ribulose-phosphate 3-epimerase
MTFISPSILAADFLNLGQEIMAIENAKADFIHVDVMDGHFVPNLTLGPPIISAIKAKTNKPLDVHLMIDNPENFIDDYLDSGADFLTIHVESLNHLERALQRIKRRKARAGVAINPSTPEECLKYVIDIVDIILVMSVNPGFGGQTFLPSSIKKLSAIRAMLDKAGNSHCLLSIDGGITDDNAPAALKAGASCLVAGSFIFRSTDYGNAIHRLRGIARG